ncbi:hypothetical protein [Neptuniibacter sp. QD37_11]|uniref:hypothetical protein n=1 Tax=Neptuniibacter sp. QD37_11 TaxID=3398209 RepID=UPI0039F58D28
MKLEHIMERYKLDPNDLSIIGEAIQNNLSLSDLVVLLPDSIGEPQAYALASHFCQEEMCSSIEEVAPQMYAERQETLSSKKGHWIKEKQEKEECEELGDLVEDLSLFLSEKQS